MMEKFLPYINIAILIATIFAIYYGPIKAVKLTRGNDEERQRNHRRMDVLRDLMKTRGLRLDAVHVAALNIIELEFYGEAPVLLSYKAYIRHLRSPLPMPDQQDAYFEERFELFLDLIQALGKSLNLTFDRGDINILAYSPIAWEQDQQAQRKSITLLGELLEGRRAIPVLNYSPQQEITDSSPFPPAPEER